MTYTSHWPRPLSWPHQPKTTRDRPAGQWVCSWIYQPVAMRETRGAGGGLTKGRKVIIKVWRRMGLRWHYETYQNHGLIGTEQICEWGAQHQVWAVMWTQCSSFGNWRLRRMLRLDRCRMPHPGAPTKLCAWLQIETTFLCSSDFEPAGKSGVFPFYWYNFKQQCFQTVWF